VRRFKPLRFAAYEFSRRKRLRRRARFLAEMVRVVPWELLELASALGLERLAWRRLVACLPGLLDSIRHHASVDTEVGRNARYRTARRRRQPYRLTHIAHVMFRHDGGELAAIVDRELTTIGDPLLDLGWMLATWPDVARRRRREHGRSRGRAVAGGSRDGRVG
jgi:hypothetical protein